MPESEDFLFEVAMMKGLLTSLNPDTKVFIPLSRILYIYENIAGTSFCHIGVEGTSEVLTVIDTLENIQEYLRIA